MSASFIGIMGSKSSEAEMIAVALSAPSHSRPQLDDCLRRNSATSYRLR